MNYAEENIEQIRNIINELHSYIGKVGAYSDLAAQIDITCNNLSNAVNKYEEEIKKYFL